MIEGLEPLLADGVDQYMRTPNWLPVFVDPDVPAGRLYLLSVALEWTELGAGVLLLTMAKPWTEAGWQTVVVMHP